MSAWSEPRLVVFVCAGCGVTRVWLKVGCRPRKGSATCGQCGGDVWKEAT